MALDIASVAAPAVAGAAAPMLQVNRCLTRAMVEAVLQHTAQPLPGE